MIAPRPASSASAIVLAVGRPGERADGAFARLVQLHAETVGEAHQERRAIGIADGEHFFASDETQRQ